MRGLISLKEAATRKGVSLSCLYKAIKRGELPFVTILGKMGVLESDLDNFEVGTYAGVKRSAKKRGPGRRKRAKRRC